MLGGVRLGFPGAARPKSTCSSLIPTPVDRTQISTPFRVTRVPPSKTQTNKGVEPERLLPATCTRDCVRKREKGHSPTRMGREGTRPEPDEGRRSEVGRQGLSSEALHQRLADARKAGRHRATLVSGTLLAVGMSLALPAVGLIAAMVISTSLRMAQWAVGIVAAIAPLGFFVVLLSLSPASPRAILFFARLIQVIMVFGFATGTMVLFVYFDVICHKHGALTCIALMTAVVGLQVFFITMFVGIQALVLRTSPGSPSPWSAGGRVLIRQQMVAFECEHGRCARRVIALFMAPFPDFWLARADGHYRYHTRQALSHFWLVARVAGICLSPILIAAAIMTFADGATPSATSRHCSQPSCVVVRRPRVYRASAPHRCRATPPPNATNCVCSCYSVRLTLNANPSAPRPLWLPQKVASIMLHRPSAPYFCCPLASRTWRPCCWCQRRPTGAACTRRSGGSGRRRKSERRRRWRRSSAEAAAVAVAWTRSSTRSACCRSGASPRNTLRAAATLDWRVTR